MPLPSVSYVVAAKKALRTALAASPTLTGVQVAYADPGDASRSEHVYLGDVEDHTSTPAAMRAGRKSRDEDFTIPVVVRSARATQEAAEERTAALAAAVEGLLADDPGLLADGSTATLEGSSWLSQDNGRQTESTCTLRVRIRVRLL
jgi:hypothetical protein